MADKPTPEERRRQHEQRRRQALESFPFAHIEVPADQALASWSRIAASGRGAPVVIGDQDAFTKVVETLPDWPGLVRKTPEETLAAAARIRHPEDLIRHSAEETAQAHEQLLHRLRDKPDAALPRFMVPNAEGISGELSREETIAAMLRESEPPLGDWPETAPECPQLSVAFDLRSGAPVTQVSIVTVPTDDWTTIPAHLRWGGWNACPAPEYHVAALRSWRERYGAELVGLGPDVMNIRVQRRPRTRTEALDLAREQCVYCNDIIDQGVGSLSALAAALMENDWWYFWWD